MNSVMILNLDRVQFEYIFTSIPLFLFSSLNLGFGPIFLASAVPKFYYNFSSHNFVIFFVNGL